MSGALEHNFLVFLVSLFSFFLQSFVVFELLKFRKTMKDFPGSESLRIVFFVMLGMTIAQLIETVASAYLLINHLDVRTIEEVNFLASNAIVIASMTWAYIKVKKIR